MLGEGLIRRSLGGLQVVAGGGESQSSQASPWSCALVQVNNPPSQLQRALGKVRRRSGCVGKQRLNGLWKERIVGGASSKYLTGVYEMVEALKN